MKSHITTVLDSPDNAIGVSREANLIAQAIGKDFAVSLVCISSRWRLAHVKDLDDGATSGLVGRGRVHVLIATDLDEHHVGLRRHDQYVACGVDASVHALDDRLLVGHCSRGRIVGPRVHRRLAASVQGISVGSE